MHNVHGKKKSAKLKKYWIKIVITYKMRDSRQF